MVIISIIRKHLSLFILLIVFMLISFCLIAIGEYSLASAILYSSIGFIIFLANYLKSNQDSFSPDGIFGAVWFFVIGLYQLNLSKDQTSWGFLMWFIILSSTITFYLGSYTVELADRKKNLRLDRYNLRSTQKILLTNKISRKKMHNALVVAFLVSLLAFIIEVIASGTIPILNRQFGNYVDFGLPYIHYLVVSMGIILILIYMFHIMFGLSRVLILFYVIGWIVLLSMLNRHVILFTAVGTLMIRHYMKKHFKLYTLGFLLLIALGAFALLGSLRQVSAEHLFEFGNFKQKYNYAFMWIYYYLTVGFTNLNNLVLNGFDYSFGLQTFTPLWTFTGLKGLFSYQTNPNFSGVGTYLEGIYLDFGIWGVLIYPFIMGLVSKYFYLRLRNGHANILSISIILCFVNEFLFMFFSDYFSYTHIPLQVIVAAIIHFTSQKNFNFNLFVFRFRNGRIKEANQ